MENLLSSILASSPGTRRRPVVRFSPPAFRLPAASTRNQIFTYHRTCGEKQRREGPRQHTETATPSDRACREHRPLRRPFDGMSARASVAIRSAEAVSSYARLSCLRLPDQKGRRIQMRSAIASRAPTVHVPSLHPRHGNAFLATNSGCGVRVLSFRPDIAEPVYPGCLSSTSIRSRPGPPSRAGKKVKLSGPRSR
jgi:hypothetical protein